MAPLFALKVNQQVSDRHQRTAEDWQKNRHKDNYNNNNLKMTFLGLVKIVKSKNICEQKYNLVEQLNFMGLTNYN